MKCQVHRNHRRCRTVAVVVDRKVSRTIAVDCKVKAVGRIAAAAASTHRRWHLHKLGGSLLVVVAHTVEEAAAVSC